MFATAVRSATLLPLFFTLSLSACGDAGDDPDQTPELDGADIAAIEALADRAVAAGIPGVSLAIQDRGQTVRIARGVEDLATGLPVTSEHRFRVASVAKSLLAAVTLQLVEEGRLRLTDTVESQLPGLVAANGHATIENLLRLESGLFNHADDPRHLAPYIAGDLEYAYTPQQLLALSNDHPPVFPPGERFMYSNTNYVVIGLLIEKLTGLPLAEAVAGRITRPLGMTSTSLPLGSALEGPYAHGYLVGMGPPLDVTGISASAAYGHGNLVSTAGDLTRFYRALVAGQVVAPARLPAMFTPTPTIESRYGIGVFSFPDFPCGPWVGHDGAIPGYDTIAYSRRDGGRQVAVLASSLTVDSKAGDPAAQQAFLDLIVAAACR
jgi:D-alanyl-D-alanine carboxypeptidase